jgi:hypothetical protein
VGDFGTIALSVSSTLALQAAYFVVLRYPDAFSEKVSSMSIFHEKHIAAVKEANHIRTAILSSSAVLNEVYESFSSSNSIDEQVRASYVNKLLVELATLRGYRECNEQTNSFVELTEEKLNAVKERVLAPCTDPPADARAIQIDMIALGSSVEIQQRKSLTADILYNSELGMRQAAIGTLGRTLRIAMLGLRTYLIAMGLWCGYLLHSHGIRWRWAVPVACLVSLVAILGFNRVADNSIKPARQTLDKLKEQNARGQ